MTTAARRKPTAKTPARTQPRAPRAKANDALADLDREQLLGLYREMQMLRKFELAAQVACRSGETPGFLHLYVGEEAVAVGAGSGERLQDHRDDALAQRDAVRPVVERTAAAVR